ncbi:MAG TPA: hypothetical protein VE781_00900, partial [Kineosporiaceae bacterium]|nr:hypothetical protein [Kineosporiaceae bacterium]
GPRLRFTAGAELLPGTVAVLDLGLLLACFVATVQWSLTERITPQLSDETPTQRPPATAWEGCLQWTAAALLVAALATALLAPALGIDVPAGRPATVLPGFNQLSIATTVLEAVAAGLLAVFVLVAGLRRRPAEDPAPASRPAWFGMAAPVFATLAWALAGGMSASVHLWIATGLGTPVPDTDPAGPGRLLLGVQFFWAAAAAVGVLAFAALALLLLAARYQWDVRRLRRQLAADPETDPTSRWAHVYPKDARRVRLREHDDDVARQEEEKTERERRLGEIAARLAVGRLTPTAVTHVGLWALLVLATLLASVLGYLLVPSWPTQRAPLLVDLGTTVMALAILALVYVGKQMYANGAFRRSIGILWDLGTFWPRATHPLAPPSYAERSVPEVIYRLQYLTGTLPPGHLPDDEPTDAAVAAGPPCVVLSCHSQGALIGMAALAASTYPTLERVALLTYGAPIRTLYQRFFPAYLGEDMTRRLGRLLAHGRAADVPGSQALHDDEPRRWPWLNLHRPSDPLGGRVFPRDEDRPPDPPGFRTWRGPDWQLVDPVFAQHPGDYVYPPAAGHVGYWREKLYQEARKVVVARRSGTAPAETPESRAAWTARN